MSSSSPCAAPQQLVKGPDSHVGKYKVKDLWPGKAISEFLSGSKKMNSSPNPRAECAGKKAPVPCLKPFLELPNPHLVAASILKPPPPHSRYPSCQWPSLICPIPALHSNNT